jgi:bifunctional non-homologous end joining protein LigD
MEPVASRAIPEGSEWLAQIKWDGVRVLAYYDGARTQLFNRKLRERTLHYPELADVPSYCGAKSAILDGEVIALGSDGKPDFHEVMRRDGIRRMERVERLMDLVPVTYMVFDLLYLDGEWLTRMPLQERLERLSEVIVPSARVQVVTSHADGQQLFDVVKQHGMEGVVVKRIDSPYRIGEKTGEWRKIKNYRDLVAVVGGFTRDDAGVANALLLGLYDADGRFLYIGHAGTGKLSRRDWKALTAALQALVTRQRPFANMPERYRNALWVVPRITVRVQFAEWTEGRSLRQPSIQAILDVPPESCVLEADMLR